MKTTTELAADFATTPRTLRKFLRSDASGIESVGKGSRYSLPSAKREIASLKKKFAAWETAQAAKKIEKDETPVSLEKATDAPETPSLDELDGPTDDEMMTLDD